MSELRDAIDQNLMDMDTEVQTLILKYIHKEGGALLAAASLMKNAVKLYTLSLSAEELDHLLDVVKESAIAMRAEMIGGPKHDDTIH